MGQGKNIFTIEYEAGRIRDFEKKILAVGYCDVFLPMSFVRVGEIEKTSYDCGGYKPIADCAFSGSKEVMEFLEKCVLALLVCCERLISPRRMELNEGTVFWSKSRREIKLAYVPRKEPVSKTILVLLELIERMLGQIGEGEVAGYLRAVEAYIDFSNGSLRDIVNYIGELKQEIHACGWGQERQ